MGLRMGQHGRSWGQEAGCSNGGAKLDMRVKMLGMVAECMQVGTVENFVSGQNHPVFNSAVN